MSLRGGGDRHKVEVERRNRELEALNAVATIIGRWPDLELTARETMDVVCRLAGMDVGAVYRLDRASDTLVLVVQRGLPPELVERIRTRPVDASHLGEAVRTGRFCVAQLARSRVLHDSLREMVQQREHRTQAALPIPVQGETWGVMALVSRERRDFDAEGIRILEAVSAQVGLAVERASLMAETREKSRRLERLARAAQRLSATLSLSEALETVVSAAADFVPDTAVRVWLAEGEMLICQPAPDPLPPAEEVGTSLRIGEGLAGRAAATREPVVVDDLAEDPDAASTSWARVQGFSSVACVPLFARDRLVGVLSAFSRTPRRFGPDELDLFVSFGNQAAVAFENARLFETAAARLRRLEALREIGGRISEQLDLKHLLSLIARSALSLIGGSSSTVYLREGEMLHRGASEGDPSRIDDDPVAVGSGVAGTAVERCEGLIVNDYPRSAYATAAGAHVVTRALAQPLMAGERAVGVLVVSRDDVMAPFAADDLATLGDFAAQAAVAIGNARLFESSRAYGRRSETLHEINRAVSASLELPTVLATLARTAADFFGSEVAAVWVVDDTGRRLVRRGLAGEVGLVENLAERVSFDRGAIGWVATHQMPLISANVSADDDLSYREWALGHGLQSFTGMPLVVGERLVGVLTLNTREMVPLASEQVAMLQAVAAQAAVGIENARLYREAKEQAARMRSLADLGRTLVSTFDADRLLEIVGIQARERLDIAQMGVFLRDPETGFVRAARGLGTPGDSVHVQVLEPEEGVVGWAMREGRPVWTSNLLEEAAVQFTPASWRRIQEAGSFAALGLPLIGEAPFGALLVLREVGSTFSDAEVETLATFANQVAVALENARLYGEVRDRLKETSALLAVGQVLSQRGPIDEIMQRVAGEVGQAFGADTVSVHALDGGGHALVALATHRVPPEILGVFSRLNLETFAWLRQAWATGRAVWCADASKERGFDRRLAHRLGQQTVLFAPTQVRGETVGGLFLTWWAAGRAVGGDELKLVEGIAAQVGLAMENVELARETEQKLAETETLLAVSRTLSETLEMAKLARLLLRHVARAVDADSVGLWLLDESEQWLDVAEGYHVPPERIEAIRGVRVSMHGDSVYSDALRRRQAVFSADVMSDPRFPREIVEAIPHRAQLLVPIVAKDRLVGAFVAVWWERTRTLTADDLALVEGIASQAGVAIENARLLRDHERRVEELSVLHELSQAVTGQLDQAGLLETIHRQVARVLDGRQLVVLLADPVSRDLEVVWRIVNGQRVDGERRWYSRGTAGLSALVLESGRPIRTADYMAECERRGATPIAPGRVFPFWLGVPMTAEDQVLGVMAIRSRDRAFTEGEERLLANIAHLAALALRSARLYEERARALAELTAAQAQLVRREKLSALGEMASGVAHDFNNLLAAIVGRAQLLLLQVQDPKHRQWLQVIERSALDGAKTVRRLQEFTRIRRDQSFALVDLNRIVGQTLEVTETRWRHDPQTRGIALEVRTVLDPTLPAISGDAAELREALTNVVLNALDAMPRGGTLTLTTTTVGEHVHLTVEDTGIGMPPHVKQRMFDPFFTTKGSRGTGLGLSMSYGILSRHGARVDVESEEGRGTTFSLSFPVARGQAVEESASTAEPVALRPLRCLVVDDEEAVGDTLGDILTSHGHQVVVLRDGAEALVRFRQEAFDAVFTDLSMPGISGWDVARGIREAAADVPIFLCTGFGVEVPPEQLVASGVSAVLSKPLRIEDVQGAVANMTRPRQP